MIHWCFVLFLVCLYVCVCECLLHNNMRMYTSNQYSNVRGPLRECRSIRPGASGLPYYCTSICVRFGCTRLATCVDLETEINLHRNRQIVDVWTVWFWVHRGSWLAAQMCPILKPNTNAQKLYFLSHLLRSLVHPSAPNCWRYLHSS